VIGGPAGPAVPFGVVVDCADPARLAAFWTAAVGYVERPPPDGYATWAEHDAANGIPADEAGYAIVDPHEVGPMIHFQSVPEPKRGKNRLHLDLRAGLLRPPPRPDADPVEAAVTRLESLGATVLARRRDPGGRYVVLADPEGNEFCVG
jgi:hypothetical protein